MIRHVVTFQFKATDPEDRAESIVKLRAALEPLADLIPGVQALTVGIDDQSVPGHWDAALISDHDSYEALAAYQVHPEHIAALSVIGALLSDKSVVDFPVEG